MEQCPTPTEDPHRSDTQTHFNKTPSSEESTGLKHDEDQLPRKTIDSSLSVESPQAKQIRKLNPRTSHQAQQRTQERSPIPNSTPNRPPPSSTHAYNTPLIIEHLKARFKDRSTTPFGRVLLIAGIEKHVSWKKFEQLDQLAYVTRYWERWKKLVEDCQGRHPTSSPQQILNSLYSQSRELPNEIWRFVA